MQTIGRVKRRRFCWYNNNNMTDLPSAVYLHFGESVLTPLESTTLNCTAVGRSDAYNLTLWKNNRLLAC